MHAAQIDSLSWQTLFSEEVLGQGTDTPGLLLGGLGGPGGPGCPVGPGRPGGPGCPVGPGRPGGPGCTVGPGRTGGPGRPGIPRWPGAGWFARLSCLIKFAAFSLIVGSPADVVAILYYLIIH